MDSVLFNIEIFPIEEQEGYDAAGDGCIGKVEYGTEEDAVLAAIDGYPRGHVPLDEWEVEHIDDASVEEFSIAHAPGYELCCVGVGGIVEDESVEEAVDDVACGSCHDECEADDVAQGATAHDFAPDEPAYDADCDETEEGEDEFASEEFPSECHSVVLDEGDVEPGGDFDMLAEQHACLDRNLDDLVDDKHADEES